MACTFLYRLVSQDVSARPAMRAHLAVPSRPSVAMAVFNLPLDSPLATPAHQVIKKKESHFN